MQYHIARALRPDNDVPSMERLPRQCKFVRFRAFNTFIAAQLAVGQPIAKRRRPPFLYFDDQRRGPICYSLEIPLSSTPTTTALIPIPTPNC
jgi:hypothetical protein